MSATPVINAYTSSPPLNVASVRSLTYASILIADLVAFFVAGLISVLTRYEFGGQFRPISYFSFTPSLSIFILVFAFTGLYPGIALNPIEEFRRILRSASLGFLLLIGMTFFLREGFLASRIVFISTWILTLVFVPISRQLVRSWCSRQDWWGIPTVILGEQDSANMTLDMLQRDLALGLRPVAVLYDGSRDRLVDRNTGIARRQVFLGDLSYSAMVARDYKSCYAILAMPLSGSDRLSKFLADHARDYRRVLVIPDFFGVTSLSVTAKDICGVLVLEVNQQLTRFVPRTIKRSLDLLICGVLAVPISPLMLLIYLAVRLSSPGAAFYGQRRIGRGGKEFKVWKFRSMVTNADKILERHLEHDAVLRAEWEKDHKLRRDPRVTAIGYVLRKTSLDELPQLWNVICGEMSLVGPRPIVESEVKKYGKNFHQYCQVTPGITGLWQISGRNNTTYELRTQIDDYYVRNWSATLDLYILARTLKTVLLTDGAY
jgi:Undecaprenyl-phosphate galactose phosphotransferase WbaP